MGDVEIMLAKYASQKDLEEGDKCAEEISTFATMVPQRFFAPL